MLWDDEGNGYLDFLAGLAVGGVGPPTPRSPRPSPSGHHARARLQPLRHRGGPATSPTLDRLLGGGGQVFFTNSGAEANECAIKLARKWGGPRPPRVVGVGLVPRPHAGHAARRPVSLQAQAFQPAARGFRHVPFDDIDDPRRALDPTVAAVLLEPVQRGRRNPARPPYLQAVGAVRRAQHPPDTRRGPDRASGARVVVRPPAGSGWSRRRHDGQGARQRHAHRCASWARRDVAAAFVPGDHATTYGASPRRRRRACGAAHHGATTCRRAADAGVPPPGAGRPAPGGRGARHGPAARLAEPRGRRTPAGAGRGAGQRPRGQPGEPHRPALRPTLTVSGEEIDEALAILRKVLGAQPHADDEAGERS